ncbi:hypothetical protein K493DRAFT_311473 [Basidiobolus meristosporus CBS 931.73]|uniref:Methyltransferase type 11 domain-containing protein n=1 Tax=Basidiobolus meristosporus CBS 931.73 TaxID=1314790 RepID=A0A1Y1Z1K7_9FUNG|nr:hypothetical protein K493DRAFT_311473 [Basidiobolus meristosporus CBS 931.73]|eukprot:ORY04178.1 hypothetical protein K493DRAFT_311473 [Basidiobolus meristosporus CBS 931.73]
MASRSDNPYETDVQVSQYCDFHYGPPTPIREVEPFPVVIARICEAVIRRSDFWDKQSNTSKVGPLRAFDLGCAVGRSTLELAKTFDQVVGADYSYRFVETGSEIAKSGKVNFSALVEGSIFTQHEVTLGDKQVPLTGEDGQTLTKSIFGSIPSTEPMGPEDIKKLTDRVSFMQQDACKLTTEKELYGFHCVLAANLIDRLYEPQLFLNSIQERIVPGGYLVLLSPYTWLPEYTPVEHWVGGKTVNGQAVMTKNGLKDILSQYFELVELSPVDSSFEDLNTSTCLESRETNTITSFHVPFVIRETHRKYQHSFSECTIWRKK